MTSDVFTAYPFVTLTVPAILFTLLMVVVSLDPFRRLILTGLYYKTRHHDPEPLSHFEALPAVTVQLPTYKAAAVIERLIKAVCNLDYPKDLLQVQILDDSTDNTTQVAKQLIERHRLSGIKIELIHRDNRRGYKAGALSDAFPLVKREFLAVFDSDFVPHPLWLRNVIHYFTDPAVGMVQSRWEHLNRDLSLLTEIQAINFDAHFQIENQTRSRTGRFFNNNGTAGIWRTKTIQDSGGWGCHLAEDAHLSIRAQLKGWQFVLVNTVEAPSELPPTMQDFANQQERWARALFMTALDLLGSVWKSKYPLKVKLEEVFHLLGDFAVFPLILMVFIAGPYITLTNSFRAHPVLYLFNASLFVITYSALCLNYLVSQRELNRQWRTKIGYAIALVAARLGLIFSNARGLLAVVFREQALKIFGYDVETFDGSPKYNVVNTQAKRDLAEILMQHRQANVDRVAYLNVAAALYLAGWVVFSIRDGDYFHSLPFALGCWAFGYVGFGQLFPPRRGDHLWARVRLVLRQTK